MKNKFFIKILFIYILIIVEVYADSITFISDNIKIFESGNLIHAFNGKALDEVFDLFVHLEASDEQLDFPVIYSSAKEGFCRKEPNGSNYDMKLLLDLIVEKVGSHEKNSEGPFQMLVSSIDYNDYISFIGEHYVC